MKFKQHGFIANDFVHLTFRMCKICGETAGVAEGKGHFFCKQMKQQTNEV